jgi:hypothetical protein
VGGNRPEQSLDYVKVRPSETVQGTSHPGGIVNNTSHRTGWGKMGWCGKWGEWYN